MASSSASASSSAVAVSGSSAWSIPGIVEISIEVLTPSGWVDTNANPPLIYPTWKCPCTRHVLVESLGGLVCTLGEGETFRIKITPKGNSPICCKIHVDGNPTHPADLPIQYPSPSYLAGYLALDKSTTPFKLRTIELVDEGSLRAVTSVQDAMSRAGKIEVWVHSVTPSETTQSYSTMTAATSSAIETTAKKSLLNGLSTAPPTSAGGTYTYTASAKQGVSLGEITIKFRDRSAVLLWLDKDAAKEGTGGSGSGKRGGSHRVVPVVLPVVVVVLVLALSLAHLRRRGQRKGKFLYTFYFPFPPFFPRSGRGLSKTKIKKKSKKLSLPVRRKRAVTSRLEQGQCGDNDCMAPLDTCVLGEV